MLPGLQRYITHPCEWQWGLLRSDGDLAASGRLGRLAIAVQRTDQVIQGPVRIQNLQVVLVGVTQRSSIGDHQEEVGDAAAPEPPDGFPGYSVIDLDIGFRRNLDSVRIG